MAEAERFRPYMPLLNVTRNFPPTMLIHGTDDTDVPYEQSVMMAEKLRQAAAPHELITIDGGEHGPSGSEDRRFDQAYDAALAFVIRHAGP
jgi:dipeptidyl aminopeptidase/acylaminoacyl peptidase